MSFMPGDPGAPACAWCGTALSAVSAGDRDISPAAGPPACAWRVARCAACGAGTTQPWPTPAELDAAYPEAYRPAAGRFGGPADPLLALTRGRLARRIEAIAPPGPVLDVGAGDGSLLRALRGREVLGLERKPDPAADVPLRDARVADLPGGWAAIVMWHALEPRREPAAELAAAPSASPPRAASSSWPYRTGAARRPARSAPAGWRWTSRATSCTCRARRCSPDSPRSA